MSRPDGLAPEELLLRRFARALTGSQEAGDRLTAEAAAIGDGGAEGAGLDDRLAFYRRLCGLHGARTPPDLAASLLAGLEGLSLAETAFVLDRTAEEIRELMARAENPPRRPLRILIIADDRELIATLTTIVEAEGHVIVETSHTCRKALDMKRVRQPELVIADLQLADGSSGVEAARQLLEAFDVPLIVLSAFPERLLTGEGLEPAFVVPKPFTPDMIRALIRRAGLNIPEITATS
jgi:CheY-like chemotaxis protein